MLITLSIRWCDWFNNVNTFILIMHDIAQALFWFFVSITLWRDRERRFFRMRLRLRLFLKNDYICMFNNFQSLFDDVFSKWTFLTIAFFVKIQISQDVDVHFRFTIKNSSSNIVSKSKKFLMLKVRIRLLRFSQSVTQF